MDSDYLAKQVQLLTDRAAISDLLFTFAYSLDTKDWDAYAQTFDADGELILPWPSPTGDGLIGHRGREGLADFVSHGFSQWIATHHLSANHRIQIDGDEASSHSYCQAVHRWDPSDTRAYWLFAGWYKNRLVRTSDGWRFVQVKLEGVWESGTPPESS